MKLSVFGLGHVGVVTAACFAEMGHHVIGVDKNAEKVYSMNDGDSPIVEPGIDDLVKKMVSSNHLVATTERQEAVQYSDATFVCVNTPENQNGSINLDNLIRVCKSIAIAMARKEKYHLVVIRTSVLPRTMDEVVIPVLEVFSGKRIGIDFGVCMNPDFLRKGSAVDDFYHPPKTVIGQYDNQSGDVLASLYQTVKAPLFRTSLRIAEMIKYVDNAFHGLKISFANEIGNLCQAEGLDSHEIMDIFNCDTKLNLSSAYLRPGFAFGGSHIPKDLRALIVEGQRRFVELPLLKAILESNAAQTARGLDMIYKTNKKRIGILGITFKQGTDDFRESPLVDVVETLANDGYEIKIYDDDIVLPRLFGSNKKFIEEKLPLFYSMLCDSIEEVVNFSEVLVIGKKSREYKNVLKQHRGRQIVIDLVQGMKMMPHLVGKYHRIC